MLSKDNFKIVDYNTIIFDCDGVILDSNKLKTKTFIQTLSGGYDKKSINKFKEYHLKNGGISRFNKFKFFFKEILQIKNFDKEYSDCLTKFSKILKKQMIKCEVDRSLLNLINKYNKKNYYVISASEEKELYEILKKKKISKFFKKTFGSPASKFENFKKILKDKKNKGPYIYFGDSKEDYLFAKRSKIDFVFVYHWTNLKKWKDFCLKNNIYYIKEIKNIL